MTYHFIALAKDYEKGSRFAWHCPSKGTLNKDRIQTFMEKATDDHIVDGVHRLSTSRLEWQSVVDKDSFFDDVTPIQDEETFFEQFTKATK